MLFCGLHRGGRAGGVQVTLAMGSQKFFCFISKCVKQSVTLFTIHQQKVYNTKQAVKPTTEDVASEDFFGFLTRMY
jgi:hypothetical protein